jgi:large subunit ribosomal protein L29
VTIIHTDELRDMTPAERVNELEQLRTELLNERSVIAAGGAPDNPGRIQELRRAIARVKTIQREEGDLDESEASETPRSGGADEDTGDDAGEGE